MIKTIKILAACESKIIYKEFAAAKRYSPPDTSNWITFHLYDF
jgi:hypothetical protein